MPRKVPRAVRTIRRAQARSADAKAVPIITCLFSASESRLAHIPQHTTVGRCRTRAMRAAVSAACHRSSTETPHAIKTIVSQRLGLGARRTPRVCTIRRRGCGSWNSVEGERSIFLMEGGVREREREAGSVRALRRMYFLSEGCPRTRAHSLAFTVTRNFDNHAYNH